MKFNFNLFFVFILGLGLCLTSCQDEVVEITEPEEQEVITPLSPVVQSMSVMTANNTASDDVLDNASCFSVELPVTIVTDNITIIIDDFEALEELEDFLESLNDQGQSFEFLFPITLIFGDYTEVVIENEEQLNNFISECSDDDVDDFNECIDFVYPISFSIFNEDFDLIDTIVIENDEALYGFLDSLDDDNEALIVSLDYPVSLVYANGEIIEVNSNTELAEVIDAAEDSCEDDDEPEICEEEELAAALTECLWEIDDEFNDFDDYYFDFNPDGSVQIISDFINQPVEGNWELTSTDGGLVLTLSEVTEFGEFFNGDWSIIECDGDEIKIVKGDLILELEQECDNVSDCDPYVLGEILPLCEWDIELFTANSEYEEYALIFNENGTFFVEQNGDIISDDGSWNIGVTGTGGILFLEIPGINLGGEWVLIECDEEYYEYAFQNGDNIMVLEKDCETNNDEIFDCFLSFDPYLEICDDGTDGPYEVDLTLVFDNCPADSITFFETYEDAENFVNPISNPSAYSLVNTQEAVFAKVQIDNESIILEIVVYIEDCGSSDECSEGAIYDYLQTCEWVPVSFNGDDNLIDYVMVFGPEALTIEGNGQAVTTTYSVQGSDPTFIFIDGINLPNIQAISGDWTVASCEPDRLVLIKNDDVLILEQDCN